MKRTAFVSVGLIGVLTIIVVTNLRTNGAPPTATAPVIEEKQFTAVVETEPSPSSINPGAELPPVGSPATVADPPENGWTERCRGGTGVKSGPLKSVNITYTSQMTCPKPPRSSDDASTDSPSDDQSSNFQRESKWVKQQYATYAKRCGKKQGVMWKRLSLESHTKLTENVFRMAVRGLDQQSVAVPSDTFALLDWASGCGADMAVHRRLAAASGRNFFGLGIELIGAAVSWAKQSHAAADFSFRAALMNAATFCNADGTKLEWIPSNSFHSVVSIGGLYHLPPAATCSTLQHLLRVVLRGSGRVVACYMHPQATIDHMTKCDYDCGTVEAASVRVKSIPLNPLMAGRADWAAYYAQLNSTCIVWEKR